MLVCTSMYCVLSILCPRQFSFTVPFWRALFSPPLCPSRQFHLYFHVIDTFMLSFKISEPQRRESIWHWSFWDLLHLIWLSPVPSFSCKWCNFGLFSENSVMYTSRILFNRSSVGGHLGQVWALQRLHKATSTLMWKKWKWKATWPIIGHLVFFSELCKHRGRSREPKAGQ